MSESGSESMHLESESGWIRIHLLNPNPNPAKKPWIRVWIPIHIRIRTPLVRVFRWVQDVRVQILSLYIIQVEETIVNKLHLTCLNFDELPRIESCMEKNTPVSSDLSRIQKVPAKGLKEGVYNFFRSNWQILHMLIQVRGPISFHMVEFEGQFPMV